MREDWSRRAFLGLCGTAGASAVLASCSKHHDDDTAAGPVTVAHIFGETTIAQPPTRVVCAGYTGQDDVLALAVVPIAVTEWFGEQPYGVWPWAQHQLGEAKPTVLNLDNGIEVTKIAELKPDLIVATNAGVDAATYQKLSAIAPTVPQTGGDAFFEPWKVQAATIGTAMHRSQQMQSLIDAVDTGFTDVAAAHPGFKDKKVLLLGGRLDAGTAIATTGWRTTFLNQMGFSVPEVETPVPHERIKSCLQSADVVIWTTESDDERAALLADPDIAAFESRSVFTTKDLAGAIAFASPLSYPLVSKQLPALINKALG